MTRMKVGAALVSTWAGINLVLACGIVLSMLVLQHHPPSWELFVPKGDAAATPASAIALIDSLGVLFNVCAAAFCALVLVTTWRGLLAGVRWAFASVTVSTLFVQFGGFASDAYLGSRNLGPNLFSSALLVTGLVLCRPEMVQASSEHRRHE